MRRLTPDQYPITLTYQRREGEFWGDRLEAPGVVIGIGAKDSFAWGDLTGAGGHAPGSTIRCAPWPGTKEEA